MKKIFFALILAATPFITNQKTQVMAQDPNCMWGENDVLCQSSQMSQDIIPEIKRRERQGQQHQAYLNDLFQACMNGDVSACDEHNQRMNDRNKTLEGFIEQTNPNNPENRSWAESFCLPYCD